MSKQELIIKASFERGYHVDKQGFLYNKKGIRLSVSKTNKGYFSFNIKLNAGDNATRSFVHRLQAYQKFGDEMFKEGIVVRHINGDSTDNSYDNIEIGTYQENSLDIPKEKRINNASKANIKHDHEKIIQDKKDGLTISQIMIKHNISSKGTVSFILNKSLKVVE